MNKADKRQIAYMAQDCVGQSESEIRQSLLVAYMLGNNVAMRSIKQSADFMMMQIPTREQS